MGYYVPQTGIQLQTGYRLNPNGVPVRYNPFRDLPPEHEENEPINFMTLTNIMKTWDNNKNYTGEPYDLLDDKVKGAS